MAQTATRPSVSAPSHPRPSTTPAATPRPPLASGKPAPAGAHGTPSSSDRGPDTRPTYFLFVDRLPYAAETAAIEADLRNLFRPFGTLRKLYRKKKAGFGNISFRSRQPLDRLVKGLSEVEYGGRQLRVEAAKEGVARKTVVDKCEHTRQVFLRNLPRDMTADILKTFIQDTADLQPQWVKFIEKSSAAFVTFATEDDAELCANRLRDLRLLDKKILAERARAPPEKVPQLPVEDTDFAHRDVLVGPISPSVTEQQLQLVITGGGCAVERVELLTNPFTGRPKGCARVVLKDAASGQRLFDMLNGKMLLGRPVTVEQYLGLEEREEGDGDDDDDNEEDRDAGLPVEPLPKKKAKKRPRAEPSDPVPTRPKKKKAKKAL
jgi:RNA recognition motif-containing protein